MFLFPVIVIGALLGQAVPVVTKIAQAVGKWLPVKSPAGIAGLALLSIASLLALCFLAGLVARNRLGKRALKAFEKNLLLLFPRYAIFKDQVAGTLGTGQGVEPRLLPILVRLQDARRIGFEVERNAELVTVYLPGAPDPWSGETMMVDADRVTPLKSDFGQTVASFEKLGRDSLAIAAQVETKQADQPTSSTDSAPPDKAQDSVKQSDKPAE